MLSFTSAAALSFAPATPLMRATRAPVVSMVEKSAALPFMDAPDKLDGSLVGDVGFDPLGLSNLLWPVSWMREAELKHGRVCMLGVVGWIAVDAGLRVRGTPLDAHPACPCSPAVHLLNACALLGRHRAPRRSAPSHRSPLTTPRSLPATYAAAANPPPDLPPPSPPFLHP